MLSYLLAVLAACANATSSVLQRKANKQVPQNENLSLKLIRSLLHEPVWFGGILAITIGFLLQASALGAGELAVGGGHRHRLRRGDRARHRGEGGLGRIGAEPPVVGALRPGHPAARVGLPLGGHAEAVGGRGRVEGG